MKLKTSERLVAVAMTLGLTCLGAASCATDLTAQTPNPTQTLGDMATRVKAALHDDPSLLDRHIDVSMHNGKVLMQGFVGSGEDMVRALRDAHHAAGSINVVNELTIKPEDLPQEGPRH